jgi:hypothetical protein
MNWWSLASGLIAAFCAAGHALAGHRMYFRPIKARLMDAGQCAVFSGMWHLITLHFALSSLALIVCGVQNWGGPVIWLIAAQFMGYGAIYLIVSVRLRAVGRLFQWMLFEAVGASAALGTVFG